MNPKEITEGLQELTEGLQELKKLTLLGAKNALDMNDVCLLTGLSKGHVYQLVCAGKIPYYKSAGGKYTYFKKQEIESWLLAHRFATKDEVEREAITNCLQSKKGGRI